MGKPTISVNQAAEFMDIQYSQDFPPLRSYLKARFREMAIHLHPDHGGDSKKFSKLMECCAILSEIAVDDNGRDETILQTIDGTPLADLGRGLENPLHNSRSCEKCEGRGYNEEVAEKLVICRNCEGEGWSFIVPCRACKGTGKFTDPKWLDQTRKVNCRKCGGTGKFDLRNSRKEFYTGAILSPYPKTPRPVPCYICNPHGKPGPSRWSKGFWNFLVLDSFLSSSYGFDEVGYVRNPHSKAYDICRKCLGKGQLLLDNPVLPKNRVMGRK